MKLCRAGRVRLLRAGLAGLTACGAPTDSSPDGTVSASIGELSYQPATWLGQSGTTLSYLVTNTGTAKWTFGAAASLLKPDDVTVVDLPVIPLALLPGQTRAVSWELPPWRPAGHWAVRASVWRQSGDRSGTPLADTDWRPDAVLTGFSVRYHTSTFGITQGEAGVILNAGTGLLIVDNGSGDVGCDVELVQFGSPASFSTGDGVIDNQNEYTAVLALPGNVKIVSQINWCNVIAAGINGCAPIPGYSFVVREPSVLLRDREVWTHEYGHTVGLEHIAAEGYLMNPNFSSGLVRSRVRATECAAFRKGP